jgi:predicted component of type VI protein secretion system
MAYLILAIQGQEWDRREITGPVVLGRSADCDISIHDILLSRRHCRFTPMGGNWLVIDLASRNGTAVGEQRVGRAKAQDRRHHPDRQNDDHLSCRTVRSDPASA